jgi:hypothetical protein
MIITRVQDQRSSRSEALSDDGHQANTSVYYIACQRSVTA